MNARANDPLPPLLAPQVLYSAADILADPSRVPAEPGLYAWYLQEIPAGVPIDGCTWHHSLALLYVGISPARPLINGGPDGANLRKRIHIHLCRMAHQSTLLMTQGCLLSAKLGLRLQKVGPGSKMTFGEGDDRLTRRLAEHAIITWTVQPEPWQWEAAAIQAARPPLNLDGNEGHPFHPQLTRIRAEYRQAARCGD